MQHMCDRGEGVCHRAVEGLRLDRQSGVPGGCRCVCSCVARCHWYLPTCVCIVEVKMCNTGISLLHDLAYIVVLYKVTGLRVMGTG